MEQSLIRQARDAFLKEVLKIDLYGYQKEFSDEILKSVIDNDGRTLTAEFSRQSGKTEAVCSTIVNIVCFFYYIIDQQGKQRPPFFNIGIFAPQHLQAATDFERIKDYMRKIQAIEGFDISVEVSNGNTFKISSNSHPPITIYCFTLSPTSYPESKTLNLIIYEESQDLIDFRIEKSASPMGASTNATEVFIGTAGYRRGKFYSLLTNPSVFQVKADCDRVIKEKHEKFLETNNEFHEKYELFVQKKERELGRNSDEFKTQYLLEWILERGQFIKFEDLMKLESDYFINFIDKFHTAFVGIDWGKANDSTVVTVVSDKGEIVEWMELVGDDYYNQYMYITELIERKYPGTRTVYCDASGNQDQAVDTLRHELSIKGLQCTVEGVKFTSQSKDRMYKNLARLMNDKVVKDVVVEKAFLKFPARACKEKEKFINQFIDLQKELKGDLWSCHHPDGAGFHDDYPDSLALACLGFSVGESNVYVPRMS